MALILLRFRHMSCCLPCTWESNLVSSSYQPTSGASLDSTMAKWGGGLSVILVQGTYLAIHIGVLKLLLLLFLVRWGEGWGGGLGRGAGLTADKLAGRQGSEFGSTESEEETGEAARLRLTQERKMQLVSCPRTTHAAS
jgi:hypothetical protein